MHSAAANSEPSLCTDGLALLVTKTVQCAMHNVIFHGDEWTFLYLRGGRSDPSEVDILVPPRRAFWFLRGVHSDLPGVDTSLGRRLTLRTVKITIVRILTNVAFA